jgi:hypothetical protein
MDSTRALGMALGGVVVAALGGIAEYMKEKEMPSTKGLFRDFIIGSLLVLFMLQILPESMENILSFLPSFQGLRDVLPSVGGGVEPDLQVGPARF